MWHREPKMPASIAVLNCYWKVGVLDCCCWRLENSDCSKFFAQLTLTWGWHWLFSWALFLLNSMIWPLPCDFDSLFDVGIDMHCSKLDELWNARGIQNTHRTLWGGRPVNQESEVLGRYITCICDHEPAAYFGIDCSWFKDLSQKVETLLSSDAHQAEHRFTVCLTYMYLSSGMLERLAHILHNFSLKLYVTCTVDCFQYRRNAAGEEVDKVIAGRTHLYKALCIVPELQHGGEQSDSYKETDELQSSQSSSKAIFSLWTCPIHLCPKVTREHCWQHQELLICWSVASVFLLAKFWDLSFS